MFLIKQILTILKSFFNRSFANFYKTATYLFLILNIEVYFVDGCTRNLKKPTKHINIINYIFINGYINVWFNIYALSTRRRLKTETSALPTATSSNWIGLE